MIAGPAGSGKTNFVILASCSQAKKGNKVIFIDTEGGFSIERIKQVVEENSEEILKNILLLQPTSFDEQKKAFAKLLSQLKMQEKESPASSSKSQTRGKIGLIIIDGMAMLYRLELGDAIHSKDDSKIKQVNREVAKQMRTLAEIARKRNIPIIITNQVYEEFIPEEDWKQGIRGSVNLVGGDLFKYWSKCIIELENNNGKRKAKLLKHRSLADKELSFIISNRGIFKRGWI